MTSRLPLSAAPSMSITNRSQETTFFLKVLGMVRAFNTFIEVDGRAMLFTSF
jgi:hypothetical protein